MKTKAAPAKASIYAVVGSDESAVKSAAKDLAAQLTPADAGDFGVETIDGCADNAEQAATRIRSAIEALQTLPFFGGGKLVWLKNANFLGGQRARPRGERAGSARGTGRGVAERFRLGRSEVLAQRAGSGQAPLLLQNARETRRARKSSTSSIPTGAAGKKKRPISCSR